MCLSRTASEQRLAEQQRLAQEVKPMPPQQVCKTPCQAEEIPLFEHKKKLPVSKRADTKDLAHLLTPDPDPEVRPGIEHAPS